jgi:CBS domain-containing protein/uncharacterized protein (DUF2267 family)
MLAESYCGARLVVLPPHAPVAEAARAMEKRGVGSVLVSDRRHLIGIVTDRDLAAEVVGRGEDPLATTVGDVMHEDVQAVGPGATLEEILAAMCEAGCRRLPIVDGDRILGIVTLDDLLLDGWIDAHDAAAVLRAQLDRPTRQPRSDRAAARREARAENKLRHLVAVVARDTALTPDRAALALKLVVGAICRRILPQEAEQLAAQLPSTLRRELIEHLDGPDRSISRWSIEADLQALLGCSGERSAHILEAVCARLASLVSSGEIAHVRRQLPRDIAELFEEPARRLE